MDLSRRDAFRTRLRVSSGDKGQFCVTSHPPKKELESGPLTVSGYTSSSATSLLKTFRL